MSLFIDKHNRRKSPFALAVFGTALLDLCLYWLIYALLAEPLYYAIAFASPGATVAVHGLIAAAVSTALSCLLFLLRDKRIVPWGFGGLTVILGMFCAAAFLLEPEARTGMLWLIFLYGLPPVLVGNAVTWPIYLKIKRANPAPRHRKTIRQELLEAAAQEAGKQERKRARQAEKVRTSGETEPERPVPAPELPREPEPAPEEALSGPAGSAGPSAFRSEEEEAMLLYMDDDEENDD